MAQLQIPDGMSMIARTAGITQRRGTAVGPEHLLQLARDRSGVKAATPPADADLTEPRIRAIRRLFQPDIGEILIDTNEIHDQARAFMDIVMPDNVAVKRYDDVPLFSASRSNTRSKPRTRARYRCRRWRDRDRHTEALVAIDVNSARATKGADIEETATRTNLEAADEVARHSACATSAA